MATRTKHLTGIAIAAFLAVGANPCFAAKPITSEEAASFKIGEATQEDVTRAFGKPGTISADSDGQTILIYSSYRTHVKAVTFVPFVGMFAGGAKANMSTVSFTFGKDGKLTKYLSSDTQADCSIVGGCSGGK
jgi:hypothetical protein